MAKMIDLLEGVKKAINDETGAGGTLSSVNKVTMYPERNPLGFPFVTVLPLNERPIRFLSGGVYEAQKSITVEFYSHKSDSRDAKRASMGMMDKAMDLFGVGATDWLIPHIGTGADQVFDAEILNARSSNQSIPYRNGFIQVASFDMALFTKEELHPDVGGTTASTNIEADAKTVVDTIMNTIKGYKTGVENYLSSVQSFKSFTAPPTVSYPLVFVGIDNEVRDHEFTGMDVVSRAISVYGIHKMAQGQNALERNLNLMEYLRQIIFANKDFGGISINTIYEGTNYRQSHDGRGMMYGSNLDLVIDTLDQLRA